MIKGIYRFLQTISLFVDADIFNVNVYAGPWEQFFDWGADKQKKKKGGSHFQGGVLWCCLSADAYPDNSPGGQFPTVTYRFWAWWVVLCRGSGPSGELSWWGRVLGIVVPVGNGWALFLSGGELSSWGVVLEPMQASVLNRGCWGCCSTPWNCMPPPSKNNNKQTKTNDCNGAENCSYFVMMTFLLVSWVLGHTIPGGAAAPSAPPAQYRGLHVRSSIILPRRHCNNHEIATSHC